MRPLIATFLVASAGGAALDARDRCNADYCLRAVRATQFPGRGASGCSSYFKTTVLPYIITETAIATVYQTESKTKSLTETDTAFDTSTVVVPVTITTRTNVASVTPVNPAPEPVKMKRDLTVIPSNIPTYASWCSGSVRYISACSCIGVARETVTVLADVTVITSTSTITSTTVFTELDTTTLTKIDATLTESTTVATKTETDVTLTTETVGFIKVKSGAAANYYAKFEVDDNISSYIIARLTANRQEASVVRLLRTGQLYFGTRIITAYWTSIYPRRDAYLTPLRGLERNWYPLVCFVGSGSALSCAAGPYTEFGVLRGTFSLNMGQPGLDWSGLETGSYGPVVPILVPI